MQRTEKLRDGLRSETRVVAVGDIHGRLDALRSALESIPDPHTAEVVLLGDYVHRGPDSRGVLDLLCALEKDNPFRNLVMLAGNHDHMLWDAVMNPTGTGSLDWFYNENDKTIRAEYFGWDFRAGMEDLAESLPPQVQMRLMGKSPTWHKNGDVLFVHAGVDPNMPLWANFPNHARYPLINTWVRDKFLRHPGPHLGPDDERVFVVHGHTKVPAAETDLIMDMSLHGVAFDRLDLDISHTSGCLVADITGDELTLSAVYPQAEPSLGVTA